MARRRRAPRGGTRGGPRPGGPVPGRLRDLVPWLAGILFVTFCVFSPALRNELVRWDDYAYIVDDPVIRDLSPAGLLHIAQPRTFVLDNYHPLTILSYALEYRLTGAAPTLYHLDNILLHLLNVAFVAGLVWLLSRRRVVTLVAAALFAVHPLRVESVVWAAERKDLLYTFFFVPSLIAYVLYARDPRHPRGAYAASLLLFLLSALSKAQAVVLPLTLLLVDYWFERRHRARMIVDKLPFIALALILGAWATVAQKTSITPARLAQFSPLDRVSIAGYNLVAYLYKLAAPYRLAAFYGYPADLRALRWSVPAVLGLAGLVYYLGRRSKPAVFGALFFLATISVVIQLVPIGDAIVADRFTYVPYVGLFLWLGWVVDRGVTRPGPTRALVWTLVGAQMTVFAVTSYRQAETWRDTETLWRQVLRIDPDEPRAHNNLGVILLGRGEVAAAITHLEQSVAHGQRYDRINDAYRNLGAAYGQAGRSELALAACDMAVRTGPGVAQDWLDRGLAYARLGRYDSAIADYAKALELAPRNAIAFYSRGNALRRRGRVDQAIADY